MEKKVGIAPRNFRSSVLSNATKATMLEISMQESFNKEKPKSSRSELEGEREIERAESRPLSVRNKPDHAEELQR